jgi:hypothetical protein
MSTQNTDVKVWLRTEFKEMFSFKTQKWQKILLFSLCVLDVIGYILFYYVFDILTMDHYYYMNAVRSYFETGNCYVHGFIYLDYFCYLYPYFLAPFFVSLLIRVFTNMMITLIFLEIQRKNPSNINMVFWISANYFLLFNDNFQLNVNSLIPLMYFVYYKYRDKYPWTSLLLLFCFYKVNSVIVLAGLIVLDILFKRKSKDILKNIMYLLPVVIIVGISFIHSVQIGFFEAENSGGSGLDNFLLALQTQHMFSYSVVLYALFDKLTLRQLNNPDKTYKLKIEDNKLKKFWTIYGVLLIAYGIFSEINILF